MRGSLLPLLALASSLPLAACSSKESLSPAPIPVDVADGFSVRLEDPGRLVVASADGRVLLDGLPAAALAEGDKPLVGFAVRDVTTTFEMEFGAFKPTLSADGPWRVAEKLSGDGANVLLQDRTGETLATIRFQTPEPGHLVAAIEPGEGPERHFSWGFACDPKDHFAGFGAQSMDVDHRGFTVPTWVQEQGVGKRPNDAYGDGWFLTGARHASQMPIPQYLSSRGYILTTETDLRSIFALCSEAPASGGEASTARVEIDLPASIHIFDGPTPQKAIERATATFGRPRLPPKVAFAPWLDAIFGSDNVRAVAEKLRDNQIPGSVIWSEDWRGGEWSGDDYKLTEDWDVDPELYPDLKGLSDDLHARGFDLHLYFNPFVYVGSKAWDETAPFGLLVKKEDGTPYTFMGAKFTDTGLIDLDNPAGRAWTVKKMRAAIAQGADGWMNDFAEWLPTDAVTFAGSGLARHNRYAVEWQKAAREAIDSVHDGQERLFFSRSGWFGTPEIADVFWGGDQRTSFAPDDGLPTVLPIGIGLGIVGVSTYGHDIAGYQSSTNPPSTKELFFRWTSLGAWSPVMRTHHGTHPLLEWAWDKDQETIDHFRRYAALHIALVPYLRGLAKHASDTGLPMWRGLMLAHPEDEATWGIGDQVLLGDKVLLAPVLTAGDAAGTATREVYLPEGRWYPWSGGNAHTAGKHTESVAVGDIPVFAGAGAVIPTYPEGVMTLVHGSAEVPDESSVGDDRVVYAFLGESGSFTEISGLGYEIEHREDGAGGGLSLSWQGSPLAACDDSKTAPCAIVEGDGGEAYVTGSGTLLVKSGSTVLSALHATGGSAGRKLRWVIRR